MYSYVVKALHCDVWVVCACIKVCIVACFISFWGSVILYIILPECMHYTLTIMEYGSTPYVGMARKKMAA